MNDCVEPRAGHCELRQVPADVLPGADFHVVQASIGWQGAPATQGWGRDGSLDLARRKAIAEAVERSACDRLPRTAFRARADELAAWLDPAGLVFYAPSQYEQPGFPFHRFHPSEHRWWLPATSVPDGEHTAVVADCACNRVAFPHEYRSMLLTSASSSGCASGTRLQDAVERATLELVERDAFMRHWFAQAPGQCVIAATLPARAAARIQRLMDAGCEAGVQCLDRGIHPTWMAWARHEALHFTCVGAATGFDAESSLESAMNEMETMALARIAGVPALDICPQDVRSPADHGSLYATAAGFRGADRLLRGAARAPFASVARAFRASRTGLYDRLRHRGHAPVAVDLTVEEATGLLGDEDLHTVRVFAPGLIPIAFGSGVQPLGAVAAIAAGGEALHPFA